MFKSLLVAASLVFTVQAHALTSPAVNITKSVVQTLGLNPAGWKVGDSASYNLSGGILQGTMKMSIREFVPEGTWLVQDMDLGLFGKQKVEVLYADDGHIVKMIVNGKEQTPPAPGDDKIIDTHNESVTVPKGTFDCIYVKIQDKDGQISQAWINMQTIPVAGMAKTIAPSQMGDITIVLTDFTRMP